MQLVPEDPVRSQGVDMSQPTLASHFASLNGQIPAHAHLCALSPASRSYLTSPCTTFRVSGWCRNPVRSRVVFYAVTYAAPWPSGQPGLIKKERSKCPVVSQVGLEPTSASAGLGRMIERLKTMRKTKMVIIRNEIKKGNWSGFRRLTIQTAVTGSQLTLGAAFHTLLLPAITSAYASPLSRLI